MPTTEMIEKTGAQLPESVLQTYRYLRGGAVVMVVMLAVSVTAESLAARCVLPSISDYYYTTAQGVLVAGLCAIGVLLIVYRGAIDTEDDLLNLAGVMAFVIAFAPTGAPQIGACGVDDPIVKSEPAIVNNLLAVVVALAAARVAFIVIRRTGHALPPRRHFLAGVTTILTWVVLIVGAVSFVCFRRMFFEYAHYAAALVMFAAIIGTVLISAFVSGSHDPTLAPAKNFYTRSYVFLAFAMVGTVAGVFAMHLFLDDWGQWVFLVEALLIAEFAAYWLIQTVELWNVHSSIELLPQPLRDDALHPGHIGTPREFVDEMRDLGRYPARRRLMRAL